MLSGELPLDTLVSTVTWSDTPRSRIQVPIMRSELDTSPVVSRTSSTPITSRRYSRALPPPYASAVSSRVRPCSTA